MAGERCGSGDAVGAVGVVVDSDLEFERHGEFPLTSKIGRIGWVAMRRRSISGSYLTEMWLEALAQVLPCLDMLISWLLLVVR